MVKMTENSAMGRLLEPIKNSAIWKSVLSEAVLCEAYVYFLALVFPLREQMQTNTGILLAFFCSRKGRAG